MPSAWLPWPTTRWTLGHWCRAASSSATAPWRKICHNTSSPTLAPPSRGSMRIVAIAVLDPAVDPVDYPHISNAIYGFVVNSLCLRVSEMSPSALGATTVTFGSCLEHEIAMSKVHRMGEYRLSFIKHDEGRNLRHLALDLIVWLMLVNFPLDCLDATSLAASIGSFAILLH
uniref:DUF7597 domain-containing protein n=1 Tax=Arundo donax TaxID=35708 RepID=A0A0A8ZJQ2_ARUDO